MASHWFILRRPDYQRKYGVVELAGGPLELGFFENFVISRGLASLKIDVCEVVNISQKFHLLIRIN